MKNKIVTFDTVDNPRLNNNNLGPIKCDKCGCQTCAYLKIEGNINSTLLCAGCLENGIEMIYKTILDNSTEVAII